MRPRVIWERSFEIERKPKSQNDRRPVLIGGKPRMITSPEVKYERAAVAALVREHEPPRVHGGPVEIALVSKIPLPQSWAAWKIEAALAGLVKPISLRAGDLDNLMKLVLDALTKSGRWWKDDSQVTRADHEKVYAELPGTLVTVRFLEEIDSAAAWRAIKARALAGVVRGVLDAPAGQGTLFGGGNRG